MQEASMSLQSIAVPLPFKETSIGNSQLHRFNRRPKPAGPRWTRGRILVINGAAQGREPSKELRLNQQDMMAIEFGRLLGESKEKTISKVLRRKIDPNSTYIGLEKEAKAGKEFIKKAEFAVKVERPKGAPRNGSMFGPDVPYLASPPLRPNHAPAKAGANADAQILDDSLLRKPDSNQSSKAVSSIMSSVSLAANNVKRPDSQCKKAGEEVIEDLDTLRRPILDKGGNALKENPPKSVSKSPSQSSRSEDAEMPEDNDSMEASKLEFQRLLDKAFSTSTAELACPSVGQSNLSMESTAQNGFRLMNAAASLPNLASPPSRDRGSIGSIIQSAQRRSKATLSSTKKPLNDTVDQSLLRKPEVQATTDATSLSVQSSEELYTSQDNQSLMPSNVNDWPHLDEASALPQLAVPPSRHQGSLGKFIQPRRAKVKDLVDNSVDESLLRKPSSLENATVSMASTLRTEDSVTSLSTSKQTQPNDETLENNILHKSPSTTEIENKNSHEIDGYKLSAIENDLQLNTLLADAPSIDSKNSLQVGNGLNVGSEALEPVLKIESSAQSQEHFVEPRTSNALKDAREGTNGQDINNGSGVKSVKVAALKKPATNGQDIKIGSQEKSVKVAALKKPASVTSSYFMKGTASEEREDVMPGDLDSSSDSKTLHEVGDRVDTSLQLNNVCTERENITLGNLDSSYDSKTAQGVEENVDTLPRLNSLMGDLSNVSSLVRDETSLGDQQREQVERLTAVSGTEQTKSVDMLRRPSQHADFSTHRSEIMILEASNSKLQQTKEEEEDWARAEALLKAKELVEVKIIGSNSAGLFISLGCLVGFLPSFELSPKRGLVDFSSWAQQKGYALSQKKAVQESGMVTSNVKDGELSTAIEGDLNDLRNHYREDVSKLMSSFVGERTKVIIKLLDKGRRRLRVSEKEADSGRQELLQKKANLMAELKLGEVVTCQVKSITPIGVFVEVDGVAALIHHSEVSWNTRMDPASLLSIGEVIKAKVCRLDRTLQRINLSLKQLQPDPLKRTLESVVGDSDTNTPMHEVEATASWGMNWPELGDLIKKLEQMDHILNVSKGRCLHSTAFAPSFQVLISTPQSNGYKLLARFENKIQEILVNTMLDREKMKECIRLCTFSEV